MLAFALSQSRRTDLLGFKYDGSIRCFTEEPQNIGKGLVLQSAFIFSNLGWTILPKLQETCLYLQ